MSNHKDLGPLQSITSVMFDRDNSALLQLRQNEKKLRQLISNLKTQQGNQQIGPAQMSGADLKYQTWADGKRRELNAELALVLSQIETAKKQVRTSFGKQQAIADLIKAADHKS